MKHTFAITLLLATLFLAAHLIGLSILDAYSTTTAIDGETITTWQALPYDVERPQFDHTTGFLTLFATIIIATLLVLVIIKLNLFTTWKLWFFLSVWFCLTVAFHSFLPQRYALILAGALALTKILWKNPIIHNLTELFIYGGLAAVFVPFLNLRTITALLILISAYDAYAVWTSKHMVKMAQFQTKTRLFAGLLIPYRKKQAILGGGDIGFPLLFSGVIHTSYGWAASLTTTLAATAALLLLLFKSQKNKYYPAMPFITAGLFTGLILLYLL